MSRAFGKSYGLILLLPLTVAAIGCGDPLEPTAEIEPEVAATVTDIHTLLNLRFNGSLTSVEGESPVQASGLSFETGIKGSGVLVNSTDRLAYRSAGNFKAASGTVEFWIKPRWNGKDGTDRFFFTLGNALWIVKDAADNLRFFLGREDSEAHKGINLGGWLANEWHHLAVTWTVPGLMRIYLDGKEALSFAAASQDLVTTIPATMFVGSQAGALQAYAVFDELRISDIARSASEIAARFAAGSAIQQVTLRTITLQPFVTWREPVKLLATTSTGSREYPALAAQWSSSNPAIATVNSNGVIKALAAGRTTISAVVNGVRGDLPIRVRTPMLQPVFERIRTFLATPAANSLFQIPVVIFRFLPTTDGANLDVAVNPDHWSLNPISLDALKRRLDTFDIRTKFMLEEGSKFRGYRDPAALPSLGYRVIASITVYEPIPPGKVKGVAAGYPVYQPDYRQILERFNGRRYVEELGVKEFWIWTGEFNATSPSYDPQIHMPEVFRSLDESNMASQLSGDISNSGRDPTDLPLYTRTYLVYDHNLRRSDREAVHNRGHQLEQMLEYANMRQDGNSNLFWQKFVGPTPGLSFSRAGWTHMPPNAAEQYDYQNNYNPVESDIGDWTPEGIGQRTLVSAHTWGDHAYPWPLGTMPVPQEERNEAHWYIYWMQSMPGRKNTIPYGSGHRMTNWWRFTGDWEGSIRGGLGLYAAR
jgi:hypothetical protein